jgi:hypothetical protein
MLNHPLMLTHLRLLTLLGCLLLPPMTDSHAQAPPAATSQTATPATANPASATTQTAAAVLESPTGDDSVSRPATDPLAAYRAAATERWEAEIRKMEELDQHTRDPEHAILFIGSSSIRLWDDIAQDMHPWPVIQRGYGGAKISDLAVFTDRLVSPHQFDALAIFVANDITGGESDKSPEEIVRLFGLIVSTVREKFPEQPIFFIEITPTPSRWKAWPKIQAANAALRAACDQDDKLHFISTAAHYLDAAGQPMPELFKEDQLHQNRAGYQRWAKLIRAALAEVLPTPAQ